MIVVPETKKAQILLIEDNEEDCKLVSSCFEGSQAVAACVSCVKDGDEALAYLYKQDKSYKAKRPDLILLDLNLPKIDGKKLLDTIKQDPVLNSIPVIVINNSYDDKDVIMSYVLQANAYIPKPKTQEAYEQVLKQIRDFWLITVRLP